VSIRVFTLTAIPESRPELLLRDLMLAHPGITVATAESCTGGGIAARLTSVDGSSAYFLGGIVAYSNQVKHQLLGVPADVLENPGAVSEACAAAMAEGAREAIGSQFAVSSTGIAGPTGGTARKPVGLVYLGLAGPGGTRVEQYQFPGDRSDVVQAATQRALELLFDAVQASIATSQ
jgi:nicotinamide-nucleotide amidase